MSWKQLDSKTMYENDWMEVREDRVINPGGGENLYGYVHFKNRAVAIVPLSPELDVWLVGQQRYTLDAWFWELPMGGAPLRESPLDAAKRELREETGLSANRWTRIMTLHPSNSITDEVGYVYLAQELREGEPEFEETEDLEIRRMPLTHALAMIDAGELTDAISVAGLLMVAARLKIPSSP